MFDRFKEEAIRVIMLTQEEARQLGHTQEIGTAFLLLGLIGEGRGIAAKILRSLNLDLNNTREEVEKILGRGAGVPFVEIPFSDNAKAVLEGALEEAQKLGQKLIGTEHLLLAIAALKRGTAYQVLEAFQIDPERLQADILAVMSEAEFAAFEFTETPTSDVQTLVQELDGLIEELSDLLASAKSKSEALKRRIRSKVVSHAETAALVKKLPAPDAIATKELLTELQTISESDPNLTEEDKQDILSQIQGFARLWTFRLDERIQKISRKPLRTLRGIVAELPPDAPQVADYQRIIAAIADQFKLPLQSNDL